MTELSTDTQPAPTADPPAARPVPLVLVDLQEDYASVVAGLGGSPIRLRPNAGQRINPLDPAQCRADSADR